jgi:hypothetical protein
MTPSRQLDQVSALGADRARVTTASPNSINVALTEMAARMTVPCDIIAVHRGQPGRSRAREFKSLRYGAFLLAYGAFEAYLDAAVGYRASTDRSIGVNPDKFRTAVDSVHGVPNVTGRWKARTRIAPDGSTGNRSPWAYLEKQRLRLYLADMTSLRHLLAHGGDPLRCANAAHTLNVVKGGVSIRLMQVEGFIQAVEDLASETAIAILGAAAEIPEWPVPPLTGASSAGLLPRPY